MKKFLLSIFPLCVILFVLFWLSFGLKFALTLFGLMLLIAVLAFGFGMWLDFVEEYIKD